MSNVGLFVGPMGCGKSTLLMQDLYNAGNSQSVVFTGSEFPVIDSRIAGKIHAYTARRWFEFKAILNDSEMPKYIFVDECQFISAESGRGLCKFADDNNIKVRFYGLLSDFQGKMFPGVTSILPLADEFVTLPALIPCSCGGNGSINARIVNGEIQAEGSQILEADIEEAEVYYQVMCRKCWRERLAHAGKASA